MKALFAALSIVIAAMLLWKAVDLFHERAQRQARIQEAEQVVLPPVTERPSPQPAPSSASSSVSSQAAMDERSEVNWDVPFTPQAPLADWDALHEEACEEASMLMVLKYFAGQPIASPAAAEEDIQRLVRLSGPAVDQTAAEVADLLLSENPSLHVSLMTNPSETSLKQALSEGKLIIVPAAGRQLGNPYFTAPGPEYHMLVLRGYTRDGHAITNDPGTKRGENFTYTWEALLNAVHDWNGGDVENGAKVVVVVGE